MDFNNDIKRNKQGFLLIEVMISLVIFTVLAGIISFYGSRLSMRYKEAKNYLDALRIAQNSLYMNSLSTTLKVENKNRPVPTLAQSLKAKGYTDAFHHKLIVRESAISWSPGSDHKGQSIVLKTIINKEIF